MKSLLSSLKHLSGLAALALEKDASELSKKSNIIDTSEIAPCEDVYDIEIDAYRHRANGYLTDVQNSVSSSDKPVWNARDIQYMKDHNVDPSTVATDVHVVGCSRCGSDDPIVDCSYMWESLCEKCSHELEKGE